MTKRNRTIKRRNVLAGIGAASLAATGVASARGGGRSSSPPGQSCDCAEGDFLAKYDFDTDAAEFVLAEGEDVVDITYDPEDATYNKDGEAAEPNYVEFGASEYTIQSVCAYGGRDTDSDADDEGLDSFASDLTNPGGQEAAISNLTFCGTETPTLPSCPFYGTTMHDPTEIHSIRYDPEASGIVTESVGDIGNMSPHDLARPNGLAFDAENAVFYFAEDHDGTDGVLFTMNEDGAMGLKEYEDITSGNAGIAGATFWDAEGAYLFIEESGDALMQATIDGDDVDVEHVTDITVASNIGLGDLAIDRETDMLYISTASSSAGTIFFSVDLTDFSQDVIAGGSDQEYAVNKQLAFDDEGVLWAHHAWEGDWWTVDLDTGEHNEDEPVANTPSGDGSEGYSDLARCGFLSSDA